MNYKTNSVHLQSFPDVSGIDIDYHLVNTMDQVKEICSIALSIRKENKIKVRTPVASLTIVAENSNDFKQCEDLIKDEVNVKHIFYSKNIKNYADCKPKINFSILGKRLPQKMKEIIKLFKEEKWKLTGNELFIASEKLLKEEYILTLVPKNDKVTKTFAHNEGIILLDLTITKELEEEGIARDLIRFIQKTRKDGSFKISDKIKLFIYTTDSQINSVIDKYKDMICSETLGEFITYEDISYYGYTQKVKINKKEVIIWMKNILKNV